MPITQLTYLSRNCLTGDAAALSDQLGDILAVSRRNNKRDGITGYLVSDGTWFLQILEAITKRSWRRWCASASTPATATFP
jgi:hypothetical protein